MRELVDSLEATWSATSRVLHGITEDDWNRSTGCPGWTVKDQLAHMVWSARLLTGQVPPDIALPELDHVRSPMAEYMERDVQARRDVPGPDVLAEFDEARAAGIAALRAVPETDWDVPAPGPMGFEMPRSRYLPIAVFDQYVHGEDIRTALGWDRDLASAAAEHSFERIRLGLGAGLERPVRVVCTGPGSRVLDVGEGEPVATLTVDAADLVSLAAGRDVPVGEPVIEGDAAAATALLAKLPITP